MNLIQQENKILQKLLAGMLAEFNKCQQCGKCVGNCQVAEISDFNSRRIIHSIRMHNFREVLDSDMLWKCVLCCSCYALCPNGINFPAAVQMLRVLSFYLNHGWEFIRNLLAFPEYYLQTGIAVPAGEADNAVMEIFIRNSNTDGTIEQLREKSGLAAKRVISEKSIAEINILAEESGLIRNINRIKEKNNDPAEWIASGRNILEHLKNLPREKI